MATGKRWTRDELLIALNVYHKLSFGQLHARNPVIIEVARKLGRVPASVAMKLCNLASLDPAQVPNIPAAIENARAFAAEVVALLKASRARQVQEVA